MYDDVKQVLQNERIDYVGDTLNNSLIIGEVGADLKLASRIRERVPPKPADDLQ